MGPQAIVTLPSHHGKRGVERVGMWREAVGLAYEAWERAPKGLGEGVQSA